MPATILDEIGGRPAVEMVVADFYERVLGDPELKPFFRGVQMGRLQQLQTDFFCAVLGNEPWGGRDLATVHAGMHITEHQFNRVALHLQSSLQDAGVPAVLVEQIVSLVATLKGQIVADVPAVLTAR
jgi:hemoglobin